MKIKSLNTKKREALFLVSGIAMLIIIGGLLFLLSTSLTNKFEKAFANNVINTQPKKVQFEKYEEVIRKIFPNGPPAASDTP